MDFEYGVHFLRSLRNGVGGFYTVVRRSMENSTCPPMISGRFLT